MREKILERDKPLAPQTKCSSLPQPALTERKVAENHAQIKDSARSLPLIVVEFVAQSSQGTKVAEVEIIQSIPTKVSPLFFKITKCLFQFLLKNIRI